MNKYTPKVVVWDVETSFMQLPAYTLYPNYINHKDIIQDWYMICGCWKELGENKVHSVSLLDDAKRFKKNIADDYHVVKTLRDMLEDVDILIHHNGDKFDLKKLNARIIYHRLPPLPKLVTIDTLKAVRKVAAFSSNRLDYLGQHLGVGGKIETSDGRLWFRSLFGDKDAIRDMVTYNINDVTLLEDVYNVLKPYMHGHPNLATPFTMECTKCQSENVHKHKIRVTANGIRKQQYQCQDCGSYFTARLSEKEKPFNTSL